MSRSHLLLVALVLLASSWAMGQDRYVVGYATRLAEGPALTVITDVATDPDHASDDILRERFTARLGDRKHDFLLEIAVFTLREEAETFRQQLLERAGATGAVELLPLTSAEESVGLWREHADEFNTWPFSAAEAKRRQLLASQIWDMPVTMSAAGREFMLIPPGEFIMGSPPTEQNHADDEVQHRVRITTPYYLARDDERFETYGWIDTLAGIFAQAPKGYRFRLPTEAEWEYAARAGTEGTTYSMDGTIPGEYGDPVARLRWNARVFEWWQKPLQTTAETRGGKFLQFYASCQKRTALGTGSVPLPPNPLPCRGFSMSLEEIHREGLEILVEPAEKPGPGAARQHQPNSWGLYDTLGRYDEVVSDSYLPYPTDPVTVDPRQDKDLMYTYRTGYVDELPGQGFIMRGGHFADKGEDMRIARRRQTGWTFLQYNYIAPNGLRLVLEKATGESRSTKYGDQTLRALMDYQESLGPQLKTGPDPLPGAMNHQD